MSASHRILAGIIAASYTPSELFALERWTDAMVELSEEWRALRGLAPLAPAPADR